MAYLLNNLNTYTENMMIGNLWVLLPKAVYIYDTVEEAQGDHAALGHQPDPYGV